MSMMGATMQRPGCTWESTPAFLTEHVELIGSRQMGFYLSNACG